MTAAVAALRDAMAILEKATGACRSRVGPGGSAPETPAFSSPCAGETTRLLALTFLRAACARGWAGGPCRTTSAGGLKAWLEEVSARLPEDGPVLDSLRALPERDLFLAWTTLAPMDRCLPADIPGHVASALGAGAKHGGKASSRRKRGRYYTPASVARFIVQQTLPLPPSTAAEEVLDVSVLDLSAGTGVFLAEAALHLASAYATRAGVSLQAALHAVVSRCLFGVELEEDAALACRWTLRLLGLHNGSLPVLDRHVIRGNALLGTSHEALPWPLDPTHPRAREAADTWTWRCLEPGRGWPAAGPGPEPFLAQVDPVLRAEAAAMARREGFIHPWLDLAPVSSGGFDSVVGNPPYLSELRNGTAFFPYLKRSPRTREDYVPKGDLFYHFLLEAVRLLRPGGRMGQLVPPYWRTRTSGFRVRARLEAACTARVRVDFGDFRLFKEAPGHHSEILVLEKDTSGGRASLWEVVDPKAPLEHVVAELLDGRRAGDTVRRRDVPASRLLETRGRPEGGTGNRLAGNVRTFRIPARDIGQGLIMPQATLSARGLGRLPPGTARVGDGIFWLRDAEFEALTPSPEERRLAKPYLPAGCIHPFHAGTARGRVLYLDAAARRELEAHPERYPALIAHLQRFAPAITSCHGPFQLHRARSRRWFEGTQRIVVVRKAAQVAAARVTAPRYVDQGVNVIVVSSPVEGRYLLALLCSRLTQARLEKTKRQGRILQVDKEVLAGLDLPWVPVPDGGRRDAVARAVRAGGWPRAVGMGVEQAEADPVLTRAVIEALVEAIEERLSALARPPAPGTEGRTARPGRGGRFESDLPARDAKVASLREGLDHLVESLDRHTRRS